ncbi:MAG: SGNH/GDSL hydrolase family protein [Clostridia bacterium]|nr:SGNH/GDSL hydrolase family protein [Clostridia bacterium]
MGEYTQTINLEKPLGSENFRRQVINSNMDKIDAAIVDKVTKSELSTQLTESAKSDSNFGYNMAEALRKYRADLGEIDTKIIHILFLGDSIVNGTNTSDPVTKSIAGRLRHILQNQYGACGEGFIDVDDPRWVSVGSWSKADYGFGGHMKFATGTSNTLAITVNCNAFDIVYHKWGGGGNVSVTVDGVAQTALNCTGTDTFGNRQRYSGFSNGSHTIVLTAPASNRGDIEGIIPYTDTKGIMVHRVGIPGILSSGWTKPQSSVGWNNLGISLAIVEVGINDCKTGTGVDTLKNNLITIVNNIRTQTPQPSVLFQVNNRQKAFAGNEWVNYMSVYYQLADQFSAACFDVSKKWGGTWELPDSLGLWGSSHDDIHPGDKGAYDIAIGLSKHLL